MRFARDDAEIMTAAMGPADDLQQDADDGA
jgi:hypothetical protein